jgi:hypothetical protein
VAGATLGAVGSIIADAAKRNRAERYSPISDSGYEASGGDFDDRRGGRGYS